MYIFGREDSFDEQSSDDIAAMNKYNLTVLILVISTLLCVSCVQSWPLSALRRQPLIESRVGDLLKPWRWIFTRKDDDDDSEEGGQREASQSHASVSPAAMAFPLHPAQQQAYHQARPSLQPGAWFNLGDQVLYFPLAQEWAW